MYKEASKMKLRFATVKGNLSVEDLWDLNLTALDKMAVAIDEQISKNPKKSFISETTPEDKVSKLKLDILKDIINTKLEEKAKKDSEKQKISERNKLLEILAKKEEASLENLSIEELKKKIAELE